MCDKVISKAQAHEKNVPLEAGAKAAAEPAAAARTASFIMVVLSKSRLVVGKS